MQLPSVAGKVVGVGCYAVNRAGRLRWSSMPKVVADDAFVRARFSQEECFVLKREHFVYAFPSGADLLGVLSRWREGNRELATLHPKDDPSSSSRNALASLTLQRSLWKHLPAFALVSCAVRMRPKRSTSWFHARRRPASSLPLAPRVTVVVAARSGDRHIVECLASLTEALAGTQASIAVIDNGARGDADALIRARFPDVLLVGGASHGGLAAKVNDHLCAHPGDLVLTVGADTMLGARAIDLLILVARRFPWGGLYCGRSRSAAAPTRVESTHAGTRRRGRWPARSKVDNAPLPTPVVQRTARLDGGLLLAHQAAWQALGGFREHRTHIECQIDLCERARKHGFEPMQVTAAEFVQLGDRRDHVS